MCLYACGVIQRCYYFVCVDYTVTSVSELKAQIANTTDLDIIFLSPGTYSILLRYYPNLYFVFLIVLLMLFLYITSSLTITRNITIAGVETVWPPSSVIQCNGTFSQAFMVTAQSTLFRRVGRGVGERRRVGERGGG